MGDIGEILGRCWGRGRVGARVRVRAGIRVRVRVRARRRVRVRVGVGGCAACRPAAARYMGDIGEI